MRFQGSFWFVIAFLVGAAGEPARAQSGAARGKVAIVDTPTHAYGFSVSNGCWTPTTLDSPALARSAGEFLGLVRTQGRLHSYNSMNNRWYSTACSEPVVGESAEGATTVCWTQNSAYAIASLWAIWRSVAFEPGDSPLGGASAGNFAVVWTEGHAYAFHSAGGAWIDQPLEGSALGGLVSDGLGIVWTDEAAYSFDPTPGAWVALDLGEPEGVSVTGTGSVALVWSAAEAEAYSSVLDSWHSVDGEGTLLGGSAGGEVALLWTATTAHCFDANTGAWTPVALEGVAGLAGEDLGLQGNALRAAPNPSNGSVEIRLPDNGHWRLAILDVQGRKIREVVIAGGAAESGWVWDGADSSGWDAPGGAYWVRAESARGVEARRIVLAR